MLLRTQRKCRGRKILTLTKKHKKRETGNSYIFYTENIPYLICLYFIIFYYVITCKLNYISSYISECYYLW